MKSTFAWSIAVFAVVFAAACGGEGSATTGAPTAAAATTSAAAATSAAPSATASATTSAAATTSATEAPSAAASGNAAPSASAGAAGSGAAPAAKKFDCGEKGQKACPMQGWMKSAMGSAVASNDGERIAKALETVARKPVAGFGEWTAIALEGAAKARAGDIDAAKLSCKKCHDKYQHKYKTTMRDQPW